MICCFKCEELIESAVDSDDQEDIWDMPDGVHFRGGFHFGSSYYDAGITGIAIEIIICDNCIKKSKETNKQLFRDVEVQRGITTHLG